MSEADLCEHLAKYLRFRYPSVIYHYDYGAGTKLSFKQAAQQRRLNQRAFPDLTIYEAAMMPGTTSVYYGLMVELKRDGTRLRKRDGGYASEHIAEQAEMLSRLTDAGYCATFAVGLDEATAVIDSYLAGAIKQPRLQQPESEDVF